MPHEAAVVAAGRPSRRLGLIAIKAVAGGCARLDSGQLEYTVVRAVLHKLRHRRRRWIAFLVLGVLLASVGGVARYRWIPRLPAFIVALLWTASGFAAISFELGHTSDIWWWPDVLFATGCAAILGAVGGAWLRRHVARSEPTAADRS